MARLKVALIAYPTFWPHWRKGGVTCVVVACAVLIVTHRTTDWSFFAMVVCSSSAMVIVVSKELSSLSLVNCSVILAWRWRATFNR